MNEIDIYFTLKKNLYSVFFNNFNFIIIYNPNSDYNFFEFPLYYFLNLILFGFIFLFIYLIF